MKVPRVQLLFLSNIINIIIDFLTYYLFVYCFPKYADLESKRCALTNHRPNLVVMTEWLIASAQE